MALDFRTKLNLMGENATGYRYIAHLYCLAVQTKAVQTGFYSNVVVSASEFEGPDLIPGREDDFFFT